MEPKKLPFIIGGAAITVVLCFGVVAFATGIPDPDVTTRDIVFLMVVIALLVATAVTTLYGLVTAFKDRNWLWFAIIIVSSAVAPANLLLAVVYLLKVRRDAGANLPGPGWHHDPTGGHHLRYWNGSQWTEIVHDNGDTSIDPMPIAPGPSDSRGDTVAT